MINNFKNIIKVFFALSIGAIAIVSCEPEADELGTQFFQDTAAGTVKDYNVIAYNLFHNDTIQSNSSKIVSATLGAFNETNFGMQKSSFVTQVRLSSYSPDFGTNAVIDSVVLQMKPLYQTATDSIKTNTVDDNFTYGTDNTPAKKVVTSYPVTKYGKYKINGATPTFTIRVDEVDEFLNSSTDAVMSNKQVALGASLGTKTFDGYLRSIKITKDTDNSELFSRDIGFRMLLDANFFQQKIINKKGSFELGDVASFIRYFKGLRISVDENDGYLMSFDPNGITATIYYKYDKTDNSNVTRTSSTFTLDLGSSNAHFNQIQYARSSNFNNAISGSSSTLGDKQLYVQGMGGPGAEIKIPASTIAELRDLYNTKKIGIMSAKVRFYTDAAWDNKYTKPQNFIAYLKGANAFLDDVAAFQYNSLYTMVKGVDLDKNPAYYDVDITQTITNTIKNKTDDYLENNPLIIDVGSFRLNTSTSATSYLGFNYTNRAYTPNSVVLVGSNLTNSDAQYNKRAQLKVIYSNK